VTEENTAVVRRGMGVDVLNYTIRGYRSTGRGWGRVDPSGAQLCITAYRSGDSGSIILAQ
jgi:hypothetical protein